MEMNHNAEEQTASNTMKAFRIEVADGHEGRFFNIKPLGDARYEIFDEEDSIGTILLDEQDHTRCESMGCELDLPLLHAIREEIQFRKEWQSNGDS